MWFLYLIKGSKGLAIQGFGAGPAGGNTAYMRAKEEMIYLSMKNKEFIEEEVKYNLNYFLNNKRLAKYAPDMEIDL